MIRKIKNVGIDMFFEVMILLFACLGTKMPFCDFFLQHKSLHLRICNDIVYGK